MTLLVESVLDALSGLRCPPPGHTPFLVVSTAVVSTTVPPWLNAFHLDRIDCGFNAVDARDQAADALARSDPRIRRLRSKNAKDWNDRLHRGTPTRTWRRRRRPSSNLFRNPFSSRERKPAAAIGPGHRCPAMSDDRGKKPPIEPETNRGIRGASICNPTQIDQHPDAAFVGDREFDLGPRAPLVTMRAGIGDRGRRLRGEQHQKLLVLVCERAIRARARSRESRRISAAPRSRADARTAAARRAASPPSCALRPASGPM